MLVGELKAKLADIEDDIPVYLSKDPEGNGHYELEDVDLSGVRYDGWGELSFFDDTDPDDDPEDYEPGVVLWP